MSLKVIICGAGEVGSHVAETLDAAGNSVTVIDSDQRRLRQIEDIMDVAVLQGNSADSLVLKRAGCANADLVVAATDSDEINLLTASIAKGIGAAKTVARVHDVTFFEEQGNDYRELLNIDRLICPEYATALAIARKLRTPGAIAIESFARGRIEMQEFAAGESGTAIGKRLIDIRFPAGTRLALIRRGDEAYIPGATSVVAPGDSLILVGDTEHFDDARKLFHDKRPPRRDVVIMGGPPMADWLCRALHHRMFSIRLFERNRSRAEELAEQLSWVTVIQADPTDRSVFDEERISRADVFIAMLGEDEGNIIAGVLAKTRGVEQVITVVQQAKYLDVIYDIGIDLAYSTRHVAGEEIDQIVDERPLRLLGTLAAGHVDVYRARVEPESPAVGKSLRELDLSPDWVAAAIQREYDAHVPGADDTVEAGDSVLVVGRKGHEQTLRDVFGVK